MPSLPHIHLPHRELKASTPTPLLPTLYFSVSQAPKLRKTGLLLSQLRRTRPLTPSLLAEIQLTQQTLLFLLAEASTKIPPSSWRHRLHPFSQRHHHHPSRPAGAIVVSMSEVQGRQLLLRMRHLAGAMAQRGVMLQELEELEHRWARGETVDQEMQAKGVELLVLEGRVEDWVCEMWNEGLGGNAVIWEGCRKEEVGLGCEAGWKIEGFGADAGESTRANRERSV